MHRLKKAFTMIELVFVIVVLGILSAVAVPQLAATKQDAEIAKGKADVASIRSAIMTDRQANLIKGVSSFIAAGTGAGQLDSGGLFGGILAYPITSSNTAGHWHSRSSTGTASSTVKFKVGTTDVTFTYTRATGKFTCTGTYCSDLTD